MEDNITGHKIIGLRKLNDKELENEGWKGEECVVLVLDNGVLLYPSRDEEGNGAGALFGLLGADSFIIYPED